MGGRCYGLPSSCGHRLRALLFVACCGFWAWIGLAARTYGEGAGILQAGPQGTHPGQDAPEGIALAVVESAAPECSKSSSSSCQPSLPECATATGPSSPHASHAEAISSMVLMVQPPREERSPVLLQVQLASRGHLHGRSCEASLAVPGQSMETTIAQVEKAAVAWKRSQQEWERRPQRWGEAGALHACTSCSAPSCGSSSRDRSVRIYGRLQAAGSTHGAFQGQGQPSHAPERAVRGPCRAASPTSSRANSCTA